MKLRELETGPCGGLRLIIPSNHFPGLIEQDKCKFLDKLGRLPCAIAGGLTKITQGATMGRQLCRLCDEECDFSPQLAEQANENDELCRLLAFIIPRLSRSSTIRVIAMTTLKRVLMHTVNREQLQLSDSIFGDFLLSSLRSSVRELRVVAGYVPHQNFLNRALTLYLAIQSLVSCTKV